MKRKQFYLGLILFALGLSGIASMLTVDVPLPAEMEEILKQSYTPTQIRLLILINPSVLLGLAVIVGTILYQKVNLRVPIIEKWVGINKDSLNVAEIIKTGVIGGIITGVVLVLLVLVLKPMMLAEYEKLTQSVQLTLVSRFLYGGITEEILLRFGLMTLIVWISSKIFKGERPTAYWLGIVLSALIFAIGHFPVVYNTIEEPSMILLTYVLAGNSVGGLIFGWLYWKKGLESAFIAHMFTHVILVLADKTII